MAGVIGSGLASQFGIANESTVNTPVAVSVFTKLNSEGLEARPNFAQGMGLGGNLVALAARRQLTSQDGGGPVAFNLPTKGMGKFMQAMVGSYDATATVIGVTGASQQIHNTGSADGKTFTAQKGCTSIDGTVNPFTLGGCKVTDWELTFGPNAITTVQLTIDAMSIVPAGSGPLALQAASYSATQAEFAFQQLQVKTFAAMTVVSGLWTPTTPTTLGVVRKLSLKGGQPKDTARWQAGSLVKAEALVNDFQPITGSIDIDYAANSLFSNYVGNTPIGLSVMNLGAPISTATTTFGFVMPAVFLEQGSTPKTTGPGIVTVTYPFTVLDDGTNGALQGLIISTDATV